MGSTLRQRTVATYPLRKVEREVDWPKGFVMGREYTRRRELLECGHIIPIKTDLYGETYAERRRCRSCARGLAPDREAFLQMERCDS